MAQKAILSNLSYISSFYMWNHDICTTLKCRQIYMFLFVIREIATNRIARQKTLSAFEKHTLKAVIIYYIIQRGFEKCCGAGPP